MPIWQVPARQQPPWQGWVLEHFVVHRIVRASHAVYSGQSKSALAGVHGIASDSGASEATTSSRDASPGKPAPPVAAPPSPEPPVAAPPTPSFMPPIPAPPAVGPGPLASSLPLQERASVRSATRAARSQERRMKPLEITEAWIVRRKVMRHLGAQAKHRSVSRRGYIA
jgi:hypothetical protein